jgi:hypothetical protein
MYECKEKTMVKREGAEREENRERKIKRKE